MKNLILITLLFITFQGKAQTTKPIDGFLGIKFRSTAAQVKEALKAKGAMLYNDATADLLSFSNVTLAGRKAKTLYVKLLNDQVCQGLLIFRSDQEAQTLDYYNALIKDISDVYGAGQDRKKFKPPYEDGDGYEITAIKSGNADYRTQWRDGFYSIVVSVQTDEKTKTVNIYLFYNDDKLVKEQMNKEKAKNNSEF